MTLELTPEERVLMLTILNERMGDFRQEIRHSTVSTFTAQLKGTERLLKGVIDKLESAPSGNDGR